MINCFKAVIFSPRFFSPGTLPSHGYRLRLSFPPRRHRKQRADRRGEADCGFVFSTTSAERLQWARRAIFHSWSALAKIGLFLERESCGTRGRDETLGRQRFTPAQITARLREIEVLGAR